jgi:hypothetical protein
MLLYLSRRGSLPLGKMSDRLQVHRTSMTDYEWRPRPRFVLLERGPERRGRP